MRTGGANGGKEGGDRAEGADWRQGAAVWAVVRRGAAAGGCGVEPAVVRVRADGVQKFGTAKNRGWVGGTELLRSTSLVGWAYEPPARTAGQACLTVAEY